MFSKLFLCLNRNYEYLRMIKFNFTERDIVFDFCTNVLCVSQLSRTPQLKVDEHKLLSILINALYDNANMSYWLKVYPIVPVLQVPFLRLFCSKMSMHCTMQPIFFQLFAIAIHILSWSLFSFLLITLDKRR